MVRPSCDDSRPVAEVKPDTYSGTRKPKDDTVTLTQSQFQQILQAIGQANNNNSNVGANHENRDLSPLKYVPESNGHAPEPCQDVLNTLSNSSDVARRAEEGEKPPIACPLDVVISCPAASLSWSSGELSPLSKVEQKRLQWEKEKAEMIDWNPWGKPGAGAPAKKTQVVAPITPRHTNQQLLMVHTSTAVPYQQTMPSPSRFLPEPSPGQCHSFLPNKTFSQYNCVAQPVKPVPPVFKSSIAFGNGDSESVSSDYFKRQQWLQELGYQREEQRKAQEQMQLAQISDPMWMNGCKDDSESISVSVDGSVLPGVPRTYIRGQGFQLDPVSAALAEERRQKAQEYQRAIREQMEEKQRRLEAERERKKLEEEAEERRLEAERARIHAEYEQEQMRIKQKAEMEERKHQALVSAVQQAQAQAEMEKKTRKIQKMLPPPPPECVLSSPKRTPEKPDLPSLVESKLKIEDKSEEPPDSPSSHRREPSRASETESCLSEQKEFGVQTSERKSSYVVDRVLTPSIFRVRAKTGRGKDCGTQTEAQFVKYATEDAESTESNTSSFHSPRRIVRVQHSKPCKVQRRLVEAEERPKWGVNQPSKSYVRMTERDPHFSKRKRMQELRRQHWARELAAQKAGQPSRWSDVAASSYPSLRGRRGASSSDCTLGYSSSEFETRSCRPFRSNSTPRYRQPSGFRSDHGSAETVAYMEAVPTVAHPMLRRRESQSSDNLPSIVGGSEPSPSRRIEGYGHPSYSLPPMRRKWHSQETFHPGIFHTYSPPHLLHRPLMEPFRHQLPGPRPIIQRRKWSDQESFDLESVVRSRVEEGSRASSAESSEKSEKSSSAGSSTRKSPANQNPLVCPEVVTGRPTPRQDRILQNLSSLRQGLLKKQKELESLIRRPPPYFS